MNVLTSQIASEEPGKLDEVANLAAGWFREYLVI
jgi:hypothetical protein